MAATSQYTFSLLWDGSANLRFLIDSSLQDRLLGSALKLHESPQKEDRVQKKIHILCGSAASLKGAEHLFQEATKRYVFGSRGETLGTGHQGDVGRCVRNFSIPV